jgi:hypothetical protein
MRTNLIILEELESGLSRTRWRNGVSQAILVFVGLIMFCVGFKDMEMSDIDFSPCNICEDKTSAFVRHVLSQKLLYHMLMLGSFLLSYSS